MSNGIETSTAYILSELLQISSSSASSEDSVDEHSTDNPVTNISISDIAPTFAIIDTYSKNAAAISIVTLKAGSLERLSEHLTGMRQLIETANTAFLSDQTVIYEAALIDLEIAEIELSQFIGSNLASPESLVTVLQESNQGDLQKNFFQLIDMSAIEGFGLLASLEVNLAEVITSAHSFDNCPICQAGLESSNNDDTSDALTPVAGTTLANNVATSIESVGSPESLESADTATTRDSGGSSYGAATSSGTAYIDPLVKGAVWDLSAGENLSYSFYQSDAVVDYYDYTSAGQPDFPGAAAALNATQQDQMRAVYDLWSTYAPFDFEEVTEQSGGSVVGDLRVAYLTDPSLKAAGVAAFAYYPSTSPVGGDTWYIVDGVQNVNNSAPLANNLSFADNTYGKLTAMHEIGHSIGLSHPFDGGSLSGQTLTGNSLTDDMRVSVMSYTNSVDNTIYYEDSGSLASKEIFSNTPMIYDIAAIEYLYGSITDANLGDTTYTLSNHQQIQTLVDSGGTDTIDLSSTLFRSIIDLTPGSLSSVGYASEAEQEAYWAAQGYSLAAVQSYISTADLFTAQDNLGIAFSATIENVIGSAGNDQISGNDADNKITGGLGNDQIGGGLGSDTAVFSGNFSSYSISTLAGTTTVVDNNSADGDDGTDTITGVEFLEFSDVIYDLSSGTTQASATASLYATRGRLPAGETDSVEKPKIPPHAVSKIDISSVRGAKLALQVLDYAIEYVSKQRSSLGQLENVLGARIDVMRTQVLNTQAAQSRIVSTDYAAEASRIAKHQIIQSAGLEILKQSNSFSRLVQKRL